MWRRLSERQRGLVIGLSIPLMIACCVSVFVFSNHTTLSSPLSVVSGFSNDPVGNACGDTRPDPTVDAQNLAMPLDGSIHAEYQHHPITHFLKNKPFQIVYTPAPSSTQQILPGTYLDMWIGPASDLSRSALVTVSLTQQQRSLIATVTYPGIVSEALGYSTGPGLYCFGVSVLMEQPDSYGGYIFLSLQEV